MKNLLFKVVLVLGVLVGFSSFASAEFEIDEEYIFNVSGAKFITTIIDKKGNISTGTSFDQNGKKFILIFEEEKEKEGIFIITLIQDKKIMRNFFVKEVEKGIFKKYFPEVNKVSRRRNTFTKLF